jgi:hypothetical protein
LKVANTPARVDAAAQRFCAGRLDRGKPVRENCAEQIHHLPVNSATSIPSLSNSPWIRDAPHSQLALLILLD